MKVSKTILRLERNELYSLTELSPIDTSNISTFHENPYLTLRGKKRSCRNVRYRN